jgi:hypothetical protein
VNFAAMTHGSAEMLGSIVLSKLVEAERARDAARMDATIFIFMMRELPDTQPPPPVFYDVAARLHGPETVKA